jgi:transcriptional regulator with XRE-family HTH domain
MDSRVGAILREARNRRKIDLSEVEEATRIRIRYLQAIENEEWDVLPGGVYTRGFIRTYASYLGLDGERLADDYRRSLEGAEGEGGPAAEPTPAAARGPTRTPRRRAVPPAGWIAVAAVLLVAVLAIVALPGGNDDGSNGIARRQSQAKEGQRSSTGRSDTSQAPRRGVSMRLAVSAEVWVCVLDAQGQHLIDGQILEAGAAAGPFRSGSFDVSFGNGEVSMLIDGKEAEIPATSSPIGYEIDSSGKLTQLSETERPTCT